MRRLRGHRGNVSLLVVVLLPAFLIAAGLVLDGGQQLRQRRAATGDAAAAARAAVQYSEDESWDETLNPGLAETRGEQELAMRGAVGSVSVNGNSVEVTVQRQVDYAILPGGSTVTGTASAEALWGVNEGRSP